MRIAIYSRKSKYTGKGESIENQVEMCKDYIFSHIPNVNENDIFVYEDEGFSAKNLDRPKFQEMLIDSKNQKFDYIICYRLDRISRNVSDFSSLIENLNEQNISFICIKERFDTSTPMGRAMMYIASVFAQLERETIAERVRDNMLMLARTGRWLGGTTPTGFDSEKVENLIIDGKTKSSCKLKFNINEIDIVKKIYQKYLHTGSVSAVSKYLIKREIKSRNGKYFSNLGIREILSNPVYCIADKDVYNYFIEKEADVCFSEKDCTNKYGLISYNKRDYTKKHAPRNHESKWIIAIGKHRGIISGKDWVYVQDKLSKNKLNSPTQYSNSHNDYSLLSGMIFCKKCGARMFAKMRHNGNKNLSYDYICSNKLKGNVALCSNKNLNGNQTDDLVCDYLMDYVNENSKIYSMLEKLKGRVSKRPNNNKLIIIENKINNYNIEIDNLVSSLTQPNVSSSLIQLIDSKVLKINKSIDELKKEKERILSESSILHNNELQLDIIVRTLSYFKEHFSEFNTHDKRRLIKLLVEKIEWNGENLDIFIYGE